MRRLLPIVVALLLWVPALGPAWAVEFTIPGLEADASAYHRTLQQRQPAGMNPAQRRAAEQRMAEATRRSDWAAVVTALEARVAGGDTNGEQWLALGRAHLRTAPPQPARAAQAGWTAFGLLDAGAPEVPALLLMADAFRAQSRFDAAILALEAAQEREDAEPTRRLLAEVRRQAGLLVRRVRTEPYGTPPGACIEFTTAPARRADFVAADWLRLEPARPGAAISREGDAICVAGLPLGATTTVVLRAGLPGEDGLRLIQEARLAVAMPNLGPSLSLDSRLFLLPRGQVPALSLTSINIGKVAITITRQSERNVVEWARNSQIGETINIGESDAEVVWKGSAEIAQWQPNQRVRTRLPLPDMFQKPGVFILQVNPDDGQHSYDAQATQAVIRTDLAPTVWRGSDGLTVQVRSLADATVQPGALVRLLARSNDILAEASADADGVVRFAQPLLRGAGGMAPQMLHVFKGEDFVPLDLTTAAFDLTDRGVEGAPHPGPLDAFAWTDRGIYRPGETVQLMALLRDAGGAPVDVPAHVVIKRPNGQVLQDTVPARRADGAVHVPIALSLSAPSGTYTVELLADPARPPIGAVSFRVDAFVPDRMAVELAPQGPIVVGQPYALPVVARFLYGAPAANLWGKATVKLVADDALPGLAGYRAGLEGEVFAPDQVEIDLPTTDADGRATLPIRLATAPDTTRMVRADIDVGVDDPSGRASHAQASVPVRPAGNVMAVKALFQGGAVDAGGEAAFEVAAVNQDLLRVGLAARMRLVRERPDWRFVRRGGLARYEVTYRDEPIEAADVQVPASGAYRFAKALPFGRYRFEVVEAGGLAAASMRFRAGWVASDSPDTPDKLEVSTDRKLYKPGETARVHVDAPFAGEATVLTLTDRVHTLATRQVAAGGTDLEVPVDAAWGPGAYATVHLFHGPQGNDRAARAIGLAWVGIDPASRTLPVALGAPDRAAPRVRTVVPVRTAPGAWVTLAAVDEGILRLTKFASPDPVSHFTGRRTLGLDIRDDWGRLIAPAEGEATVLRQGGDDAGGALPEIPQKTVALFTPPVQAGADGVAQVPLDLPDFAGQVRLMAVAWQGNLVGAASAQMLVRDPLVAEPLLPRFLAPGDEVRLAVLMQNLELPSGEAVATVSVEGPLALVGETRLAATLAVNQQVVRATVLRATGVGRGVVKLDVAGPGGFRVQREVGILARPARAATSVVAASELGPRVESRLEPALAQMVPGTGRARAVLGGAVRYDVAALLRALDEYPLACLEQVTSQGLPLALLPDGELAGPDRAGRLQKAVAQVLDRQRFDGGFGLWSANGTAEGWLSAYATEFLLRARQGGAAVPDGALRDALKFAADALEEGGSGPEALAVRAYNLYVLAMAGQPRTGSNRLLAEKAAELPTPLARVQLAAALARSNDRPRAEELLRAALASSERRFWYVDRGSALRDQAALVVLVRESGLLPERLPALFAALPGADLKAESLSTQEQAWAAAAAAVLGRDGRPVRVALDGTALPAAPLVTIPLTGAASVRNLDDRPVWQTVSTTGVPIQPLPAARNQARVTRQFFTLAGEALNLDTLKQNTVFVLLLEGRMEDGQDHAAMVLQGLPAGWEVAGRLVAGKVGGMPWLGELSDVEAQPAADDRFAAVLQLSKDSPGFRVAVRLRAVTPGVFELPGAVLADMYRPGVFARQNTGRVTVLAAE